MKKTVNNLLVAIFLVLLIISKVNSQPREQVFAGARPLALGETFVAIADDGNAICWNPAGLAHMERIQASFAYSDLFGIGINNYYTSFLSRLYFIPPLTDYLSFGMDWLGIQNSDEEINFHRNQFNFALAFKPPKHLPIVKNFSLGFNAKYIEIGTQYEETTELDADGWGWDVGILYHLNELPYIPGNLNLGMMIHDATGTPVIHHTGVKETILPQNIRLGFSYRPFEDLPDNKIPVSDPIIAVDVDDRIHLGLEFWLWRNVALRAGLQKDLHTDEKMILSFGLGFKTKWADLPETNVDYAFTDSPFLPNSNKQFGGSIIIRENPRLIRIEGAHIRNVFASLYLHYGRPGASIGLVKLRNVSDDTLKTWVSFQESRYMESQKADTVIIAPDKPIDFPLRAVFKPDIFHAPEGRLTGEIKVNYTYKNNEYASTAAIDFKLYSKNYLTWDDPGKATAFVTYDHPLIQTFVDQALRAKLSSEKAGWFQKYNMADALVLFNALKTYGVTYRLDPVTPFPSLADTLHGALYRLDKIQYPAEFLSIKERFGDCDDFSVLYASLLQNAGLATALVSIPGHVLMMFDTGIHESRILSLPVSSELFFKWNHTLWIPIETTMIPTASFIEAWKMAASFISEAKNQNNLEICEVAVNQKKYPPVSSVLLQISDKLKLTIPNFTSTLKQDLSALDNLKAQYFETLEDMVSGKLIKAEKIKIQNRYGTILGQNGETKRAKVQFNEILTRDSTFVPAWNNLGNIEFMQGNLINAESLYTKTLKLNPFNRGTCLNLAILYKMMIDRAIPDTVYYQQKYDLTMKQVVQLCEGKVENALSTLGLEEQEMGGKTNSLVKSVKTKLEKVKTFLDISFKQYLQQPKIKGAVLMFHDVKSIGQIDKDRGEFLFWSH